MWCSHCKQDVPAQQQPPEAALRCGVCTAVLRNPADGARASSGPTVFGAAGHPRAEHLAANPQLAQPEPFSPGKLLGDWRVDEDLENVRRLIRRTAHRLEAAVRVDDSFSLADCLETNSPAPLAAPPPVPEPAAVVTAVSPTPASQPLPCANVDDHSLSDRGNGDWTTFGGWVLVCLGAMGLVFASVLFTATMLGAKHSQPVWPLCLLSAFAGQFLVVIGFLLRHNGRRPAENAKPRRSLPAVATAAPTVESPAPVPVPSVAPAPSVAQASSVAPAPNIPRAPHSRPPWSTNVDQALAAPLDRQR